MSYADDIAERFPDDLIHQLDGYDDCIIGFTETPALVYSITKILESLQKDMTEEDAMEYYDYNIARTVEYATLECVLVWDR